MFIFSRLPLLLFVLMVGFLLLNGSGLMAQKLYWTENYGSRSSLLGGQVVAGAYDNSAIFYNPGAMGFIPKPNFSVSANTYGFETIKLQNAIGDDEDMRSFQTKIFPSFVSGLLKTKDERIKVGYGIYFRSNNKLNFQSILESTDDVISTSPGSEFFEGRFDAKIDQFEQWFSAGLAYKINDRLSLGLTQSLSYLNVNSSFLTSASADAQNELGDNLTVQSSNTLNDRMNYVSLLWKFGLAFHKGKFKLGFTMTSPNIKIYGRSNTISSQQLFNFNEFVASDNFLFRHPSYIIQDEDRKLPMKYKTPFSFALGLEHQISPKFKIMGSTEVFLPLDIYTVYQSEVPTQPRPSELFEPIDHYLNSTTGNELVINAGLGLEYIISPKLSYLASFRTNFNNINFSNTQAGSLNAQVWSYYHGTCGLAYRKKASELALGFDLGVSVKETLPQFVDFSSASAENLLFGEVRDIQVAQAISLNLIFGYTYYLKR